MDTPGQSLNRRYIYVCENAWTTCMIWVCVCMCVCVCGVYLNNPWYAGESGKLVAGALAMCRGKFVEKSGLAH